MTIPKFAGEDQHFAQLNSVLQPQFTLAEQAYEHWLNLEENRYLFQSESVLWPRNVNVPISTIRVAMTLNVQMCRLFRSIIDLCKKSESLGANVLGRTLYETVLVLEFVVRNEVTLFTGPVIHKSGVDAGKQKIDADSDPIYQAKAASSRQADKRELLTRDQRAKFYVAHDHLNLLRHAKSLANIPGMEAFAKKRLAEFNPVVLDKIQSNIGPVWYSILKHSDYCSGLSVKDLTTVLDPAFAGWHGAVYPIQSKMGHAGDALQHLGDAGDGVNFRWKMLSDKNEVAVALLVATTLFLSGLRVLQDCVYFSADHEEEIQKMIAANAAIEQAIPG